MMSATPRLPMPCGAGSSYCDRSIRFREPSAQNRSKTQQPNIGAFFVHKEWSCIVCLWYRYVVYVRPSSVQTWKNYNATTSDQDIIEIYKKWKKRDASLHRNWSYCNFVTLMGRRKNSSLSRKAKKPLNGWVNKHSRTKSPASTLVCLNKQKNDLIQIQETRCWSASWT